MFAARYANIATCSWPPPPQHSIDPATAGTYIYPVNIPKRNYQFEIVQTCLLENTLVALPTGLGKTFIAGTVLLNCESRRARRYLAHADRLLCSQFIDGEHPWKARIYPG